MVEIQPNNKWPIMRGKILAAKFEKNKTCTQNITPYMSRKGPDVRLRGGLRDKTGIIELAGW